MNTIIEDCLKHNSHWTKGINKDTESEGYFIDHAGSLWMGQPNTQNTIDEILELGKKYHYEWNFTDIDYPNKGGNLWQFRGNFVEVSNCFSVWIWDEKLAQKIKGILDPLKKEYQKNEKDKYGDIPRCKGDVTHCTCWCWYFSFEKNSCQHKELGALRK